MISTVYCNRAHEPLTLAAIRANPRAHAWALRCGRGLAESLYQHDPAALSELGTLEGIEAELQRITAQLTAAPKPAAVRTAPAATAAAPRAPAPLRLADIEAGRAPCSLSFLEHEANRTALGAALLAEDPEARRQFGDDAEAVGHYLAALMRGTVRPPLRGRATISRPARVTS
jgi:hypothetical protein